MVASLLVYAILYHKEINYSNDILQKLQNFSILSIKLRLSYAEEKIF